MGSLDVDKLLRELGVDLGEGTDSRPAPALGETVNTPAPEPAPEPSRAHEEPAAAGDAPDGAGLDRTGPDTRDETAAPQPLEDTHAVSGGPTNAWDPFPDPFSDSVDTVDLDGKRKSSSDIEAPISYPRLVSLYDPQLDPDRKSKPSLDEYLEANGAADAKTLTAARKIIAKSPNLNLISVLIDQGASEHAVLRCAAEWYGYGFQRLDPQSGEAGDLFDATVAQRLSIAFCKDADVLPLASEPDRITLGIGHPDDVVPIESVRARIGARSIRVVVVPPSDIRTALEPFDVGDDSDVDVDEILSDIEDEDVQIEDREDDAEDLEKEAADAPVIRYVNYIIQTALKEGASDIHVEPGEKTLKVRFRIDGVLFEMLQPPLKMAAAITSRLKIMGNLDISERRIPQDGRIRCMVMGRKLDLRMSTLPTAWGEKTVLRILDQKSINVPLEKLGFDDDTLTIWKKQIDQPYGVVLVTGPTGSGKTTTLYSSLRAMDRTTKNISTVEDPVEYQLDGIAQTGTHDKIGMTFAAALKALLRQDPDIIMVGEIRDYETAVIAIQAALTGHLVLSTLHTNDAPSAITRLVNIGIEPFLLGGAVNAVLAQRLVRRICERCIRPAELSEDQTEFLELQGIAPDVVKEGAGCGRCRNLGYSGRLGIYELLVVDDHLRDIVARNPNVTEFRRTCCERGMVTLRQDGFAKVGRGETTLHEVIRVTEAAM